MLQHFMEDPRRGNSSQKYFQHLFKTSYLSDVTVTLETNGQNIILNLHRNIISMIPYFDMLVRNSPDNNYHVVVPHLEMSKRIMMRCYSFDLDLTENEKIWYLRCCNFFNIECNYKILGDIVPDNYDDLVILASEYSYDNYFMKILIENLPKDYDLGKLSPELLSLLRSRTLISPFQVFKQIDNIDTWSSKNLSSCDVPDKSRASYSDDHTLVAIYHHGKIMIKDIEFSKNISEITVSHVDKFKISSDNSFLLVKHGKSLSVWNINDGSLKSEININSINFWSKDRTLVVLTKFNLNIFDIENLSSEVLLIDTSDYSGDKELIDVRIVDEYILVSCKNEIRIYLGDYLYMSNNQRSGGDDINIVSEDGHCVAVINQHRERIIVYHVDYYNMSIMKITRENIEINWPEKFYFSKDNKYLIMRYNKGYSCINIDGTISNVEDNAPEKRFRGMRTDLTKRLDDAI